jgi:hypothetical protein
VAASLADVGGAARLLGWRAEVPLEAGLREFAAWAGRVVAGAAPESSLPAPDGAGLRAPA